MGIKTINIDLSKLRTRVSSLVAATVMTTGSLVAATPLFLNQTAFADTYDVCAGSCTYHTIQAAVDAASDNDTITVGPGQYTSTRVDKSLTLLGAQAGNSATTGRTHNDLMAESTVVGGPTYNDAGFIVTASGVKVDGFDFGPAAINPAQGVIGIDLGNSSGARIKNSIFQNNQRGISLNGASDVEVYSSLFKDNNSSPENNASIWGDGVNTISITGSELSGASNTAINLASNSKNITISENNFVNNGNTAVIWGDQNLVFSHNTGTNFTGTGLYITGTQKVSVRSNKLSAGPASGISFSDANGSSSEITVTENTITGFLNGINVYKVSDTAQIHANNLANNTNGVNNTNGSPQANATQNWWGSATGPKDIIANDGSNPPTNPGGTGSTALGKINYSPFCTNAGCYTTPTNKDQCKNDNYKHYTDDQGNGFKNQGQCVSYTNGRGQ